MTVEPGRECRSFLPKNVWAYVHLNLRGVAGGVGALCGIWANRKSFLLAPRHHASQSGRYPVRIRAAFVWEATAANERLGH